MDFIGFQTTYYHACEISINIENPNSETATLTSAPKKRQSDDEVGITNGFSHHSVTNSISHSQYCRSGDGALHFVAIIFLKNFMPI